MLVGMDQWRFSRHQSFTAATARAKRPLAVTCRTMFFPFRDRPQSKRRVAGTLHWGGGVG
jgi:hypothetical protein